MHHCRGLPAKRGSGSIRETGYYDFILEGYRKRNHLVLVELETVFETGLGELVDQVILFFLRQQKAPRQLRKPQLRAWTGGGIGHDP